MTLTIDVPPELETKLEIEARSSGISKYELVLTILEEKLINGEKTRLPDKSRIVAADLPVRDFSREQAWLERNRDEYDGQYVALDGDRLVANSEDSKEVKAKVKELGLKSVYVIFVEGSQAPRFISGGVW